MKCSGLSIIFSISVLLCLSGCSMDPNEQANKLYTEASQVLRNIKKTEEGSYSDALDSYMSAKDRIDRILSKYPSSNMAVGLLSANIQIDGLTLSQFQELEDSLRRLAEAEQIRLAEAEHPLSYALVIVRSIEDTGSKARVFTSIVGEFIEVGQKGLAVDPLAQALEIAKTFDGAVKASALTSIAGAYTKAGQKDRAVDLLDQALQIAKTIDDEEHKASALTSIAGA